MTTQNTRALDCTGLVKTFGGVTVVKSVDFTVPAGHVVGLIGENGAGKSTLMKTLYGMHQPDEGTITVNGQQLVMRSPTDAIGVGIGMVTGW